MKQKPAKRGTRAWAIAIPAGILLLLLLAAFLIGNGGASAFRDDVDAILAAPRSEELGELSFADDGSAVVRLYKNDLYVLADESGVLPGLRRQMRERFGDLDFGIRLTGGKMRVCISQRVLGLVPVSMQIVTSLSWDGTGIVIHAESVLLGSRTALPKSLWPDSVREDFRVDLAATGRTQEVADVYLDGSAAVVETVPLRLPTGDSLHPDAQLLEKIRFFGADDKTESAAALLDRLAAGDVPSEDELPAGSRAELLAWLLALQTDDGDSAMFSTFFARRSERIREDIDAFLSAEEGKYVKLLTSVRELYKSRALRIEQNGFYVISTNRQFDPFASTELSATATDARVVLLTSGSGAPEVSQADMPVLKNVERRGAKALDGLDPEHAYDVGAVLTTDWRRSGAAVPALRRRDRRARALRSAVCGHSRFRRPPAHQCGHAPRPRAGALRLRVQNSPAELTNYGKRANGTQMPLALFYHRIGSAPRDSMLLPSAPRLRRYAVSAARSR